MKYLFILALLFPLVSFSQINVKIGDDYSLKLDSTQWKKVSGSHGYSHKNIQNLFFSVNKNPLSPGQKNMSSKDFLKNALNSIKSSGYDNLEISSVKTFGDFSYYIFSYLEDDNGAKIKSLGIYAVHDTQPDIKIMFGGKSLAENVIEKSFKEVSAGIVKLQ